MVGETISHYKIIKQLGEGSRGIVYKAEDLKLNRFVALKFFPTNLEVNEREKERFIQEAKAASALDHENICTVHEIDETEHGQIFICMALYEGETLMDKVKRGPLKLEEVVDISIQVARGMEKAHQKGIVHRDIKPQNLIITEDGVVKIVDFGLAKLEGQKKLTREGITVGTVSYMSPEQARGDIVDHRTDIWSLGIVMYEMITGRLPFRGEFTETVIHSILGVDPDPITALRSGIPLELERIVNKCLSKDSSYRYLNFADLIVDLRQLKKELDSATTVAKEKPVKKSRKNRVYKLITSTIIIMSIIIATGYILLRKDKKVTTEKDVTFKSISRPSIAVLPFKDISLEKQEEYFCDGMVEELINTLSKIKELKVTSRTSSFQFKGRDIDIREIGKKLNVTKVLEGSIRRSDSKIRITVQLINVSDGFHLWSQEYDREYKLEDIFEIQDEITQRIVTSLKIELAENLKIPIFKHYTENTEAYNLYLKGRYFWNKRMPKDLYRGIDFFRRAIEKDKNYALAYVGLADSYHLLSTYSALHPKEALPLARKAVLKALEIDDTLGEAHNSFAGIKFFYDWNFKEAEIGFKRSIELNPNFYPAYAGKAWVAWNEHDILEAIQNFHKTIAVCRGRQLPEYYRNLNQAYFMAGFREQSEFYSKKALELDGDSAHYYSSLSNIESSFNNDPNKELELLIKGYRIDTRLL